jgi:hypothetical protein
MSKSILVTLTKAYLAKPTVLNLVDIHQHMRRLLANDSSSSMRHRVLAFRMFLFRHECLAPAKRKFKVFTAREYLIRFTRPSCSHGELDSPRRCAGFLNRAAASSAHLSIIGS